MVLCIYVKTCWGQVKMVAIFKIYGITSHKWTEKKKKLNNFSYSRIHLHSHDKTM